MRKTRRNKKTRSGGGFGDYWKVTRVGNTGVPEGQDNTVNDFNIGFYNLKSMIDATENGKYKLKITAGNSFNPSAIKRYTFKVSKLY